MIRSKNSTIYYRPSGHFFPVSKTTTYRASPDVFRPTRKGLGVTTPNQPATSQNANAFLRNNGAAPNDPADIRKIYLWVDAITTGWNLSGDLSQVSGSRSFYPKNLTQTPITITGHVANQYEYDRLVRFVERAHFTSLNGGKPFNLNWNGFVDFLLYRPSGGHSFDYLPDNLSFGLGSPVSGLQKATPFMSENGQGGGSTITGTTINLGVVIENIKAGHERFIWAPAFTLQCKVIDDRTDSNRHNLYHDMMRAIGVTTIFGNIKPTPYVAESSDDISTALANPVIQKDVINAENKVGSIATKVGQAISGF